MRGQLPTEALYQKYLQLQLQSFQLPESDPEKVIKVDGRSCGLLMVSRVIGAMPQSLAFVIAHFRSADRASACLRCRAPTQRLNVLTARHVSVRYASRITWAHVRTMNAGASRMQTRGDCLWVGCEPSEAGLPSWGAGPMLCAVRME